MTYFLLSLFNLIVFILLHNCIAFTMIAPCLYCQSNPFKVIKHEDFLREEALLLPDDFSPSLDGKHLYQVSQKMFMAFLRKKSSKNPWMHNLFHWGFVS